MNAREELLNIQKTITDSIKKDIRSYQSTHSGPLKKYLQDYKREFANYREIFDKQSLLKKIRDSDIAYLGDYHTLDQSQKTVIKILRELVAQRKITIALEMVYEDDQKHLNDYLKGRINEKTFLDKIDYYINWGFPWKNYKPIFDFSKKNSIRVLGLNCRVPKGKDVLIHRDSCAARIIYGAAKKYPQDLIFVFYGDLHVAERHIPRKVSALLKKKGIRKKQTIVFQNSERLYWKLADEKRTHNADVVKISPSKFCILNTPPWIKLQTYLNWLEKSGELLLSPEGNFWNSDEDGSVDYHHKINGMIKAITSFFNLKKRGLDQFQVYSSSEVEFVDFIKRYMKSSGNLSLKETELIRSSIIYDGISLYPDRKVLYISNLSINKISEKVAQLISYNVSGYYPKLAREGDKDFFYSRVLFEALGFIGSKVINFKRKADRLEDYKSLLLRSKGKRLVGRLKDEKVVARFVLKHKQYESRLLKAADPSKVKFRSSVYKQQARVFMGVTKALGFMAGNSLFNAMMNGKIYKIFISRLFAFKPKRRGESFKKYLEILRALSGITDEYKSKTERF